MKLTRRAFVKSLAISAAAGSGILGYGHWGERFALDITAHEAWMPALPSALDGLRIAHLTDLHHSRSVPLDYLRLVMERCNDLRPDLIVLTGDYITEEARRWMPGCAEVLASLRAPLGVYATLGNHDEWAEPRFIADQLRASGITVLENQAVEVATGLWLLGLGDVWEHKADLPRTLAQVPTPDKVATVLLVHEPDFADTVREAPIELQLSGNSHGGQVILPTGPLALLPYGVKYPVGRYELGTLTLYTSRGIGVGDILPLRLNCRPELPVFTLHSGSPPTP